MTRYASYNCRRPAFSYAEVIVAVIIVTGLTTAAMRLFSNVALARNSAVTQDAATALATALAHDMLRLHYRDPRFAEGFGVDPGENPARRDTFNDIDDYAGWSASPPQDINGQPLTRYADYTREVEVEYVAADDFDRVVAVDQGFKRVTITISRQGRELVRQTYIFPETPRLAADGNVQLGW